MYFLFQSKSFSPTEPTCLISLKVNKSKIAFVCDKPTTLMEIMLNKIFVWAKFGFAVSNKELQ